MSKVDTQILYSGDVELSRNYRHQYKANFLNAPHVQPPDRIASATGITGMLDKSGPLIPWAVNQMSNALLEMLEEGYEITATRIKAAKATYRKTKEDAASLGSRVHEWVHAFVTGGEVPDSQGIEAIVDRFNSWWTARPLSNAEPLGSERFVYSVDLNYAGQVDEVRRVDDTVYVIDYKTSKGVYVEHHLQLAGYVQALKEEGIISEEDTVQRLVIHIDKVTGGITPYNLDEMAETDESNTYCLLQDDVTAFNGLRIAHYRVKGF